MKKQVVSALKVMTLLAAGLLAGCSQQTTAKPATALAAGDGFWSTSGSKIVDSSGNTIVMTGVNWFGFETSNYMPHGIWAANWKDILNKVKSLGFTVIRLPYSDDIMANQKVQSVNDYLNPDLAGITTLGLMDKLVEYSGELGLRIILDRHRPDAGGQSKLWYTATVSEATWIANMKTLAARYKGNPTVVGFDLHNEPHADGTAPNGTGACWGCGDTARDWRLAAERGGNAVLASNPDLLIIVEGASCPSGATPNAWDDIPDEACGWWGGNLSAAREFPVRLSNPKKLVYSAHDYGMSVYNQQSWFLDASFPATLVPYWDKMWGYLVKENIAPVLVGEFGSTLEDPKDKVWLPALMNYMKTNGMSFTYWSLNPNSGDTKGILLDDWSTVDSVRYDVIKPFLHSLTTGGSTGGGTDTTAPTVSIASTTTSITAAGSLTLTATAADAVGVTKVEFYDGSALLVSDTSSPYSTSVSFTSANNGTKTYTARAYDAAGNTRTSTPVSVTVNIPAAGDTTAPTAVTVSSSASSVTAAGSITLTSTASDNVGIAKIEFYDGTTLLGTDTSSPYSQTVSFTASSTAQTGTKSYTAKAYDAAGNTTTSSAASVTLNIPATTTGDTAAPTAVTVSSSASSVTAAGSITLTSTASDNVGIAKIEFYDGTTLLGTDTSSPYNQTVSFTASSTAQTGTKSYTAKAYDAAGNATTSSAVAVTLNIPATTTSTGTCKVTYTKTSEWPQGATISITVANTGTSAITAWSLAYTLPTGQSISNIWSATNTGTSGAIALKGAGYNNNISANSSINFGMNVAYASGAVTSVPTSFSVNGAVCQ